MGEALTREEVNRKLSWRRWVERYKNKWSPRTYERRKRSFARWENRLDKPMWRWDSFDVEEAFSAEIGGSVARSTLVTYRDNFSAYAKWSIEGRKELARRSPEEAERLGLITQFGEPRNPAEGFGNPRRQTEEKPTLTKDEVRRLLRSLLEESEILCRTAYLIYKYVLRGFELLPYKIDEPKTREDIYFEPRHDEGKKFPGVTFRVKGGGKKTLVLDPPDRQWIEHIRDNPPFVVRTFRRKLKEAAERADIHPRNVKGVSFRVSTHILRHTVLTHLGEAGATLKQLETLGGWAEGSDAPSHYVKTRPRAMEELQRKIDPGRCKSLDED
jgi:integrase